MMFWFAFLGIWVLVISAMAGPFVYGLLKSESLYKTCVNVLMFVLIVFVFGVVAYMTFEYYLTMVLNDLIMLWVMGLFCIVFFSLSFVFIKKAFDGGQILLPLVFTLLSAGIGFGFVYKGVSIFEQKRPSYRQVVALIESGHQYEATTSWCHLTKGSFWRHARSISSCWKVKSGIVEDIRQSPEMRKAFFALIEPIVKDDIIELNKSYAIREHRRQRENIQDMLDVAQKVDPKWPLLDEHLSAEYGNCSKLKQTDCFEMLLRRWEGNHNMSHQWFQKACHDFIYVGYHRPEKEVVRNKVYPKSCLPNTPLFGLNAAFYVHTRAQDYVSRLPLFQVPIQEWELLLSSYKWSMVPFDENHWMIFNEHHRAILLVRTAERHVVAAQILLPPQQASMSWTLQEVQSLFERLTGLSFDELVRSDKKEPALLRLQRNSSDHVESATFGEMPRDVSIQVKTLVAYHEAVRVFHRKSLGTFFYYENLTKERLKRSSGLSAVRLMRDIDQVLSVSDLSHIKGVIAPQPIGTQDPSKTVPLSMTALEKSVYKPFVQYRGGSSSSPSPSPSSFSGSSNTGSSSSSWGTSSSTTIYAPSNRSNSFGSRSSSSGGYRSGKN